MPQSIQCGIQSDKEVTVRKSNRVRAQQIFERLQEAIVSGELKPNQRLVESQIAKSLGMRRTPVREALKQLEITGYLNLLPNGGYTVADFSLVQIQSLFEIRIALEPMAIKLACEIITNEQIKQAEDYYERSSEAIRDNDIDKYLPLHRAFHEALYAPCGNQILWKLVRMFRYQYFDLLLTHIYSPRDWSTQIAGHGQLLKVVKERNGPRAAKMLERQIRATLKIAKKRLL